MDEDRDLAVESLLDLLQSQLVVGLRIVEHLLVHGYLLAEGFLNPVPLDLHLQQPFLHEAVHGLKFTQLAAAFFSFLESGGFSVDDIIGQLAGSVGELGPCGFSVFLGREIGQFGWRDIFLYPGEEKTIHDGKSILSINYIPIQACPN